MSERNGKLRIWMEILGFVVVIASCVYNNIQSFNIQRMIKSMGYYDKVLEKRIEIIDLFSDVIPACQKYKDSIGTEKELIYRSEYIQKSLKLMYLLGMYYDALSFHGFADVFKKSLKENKYPILGEVVESMRKYIGVETVGSLKNYEKYFQEVEESIKR